MAKEIETGEQQLSDLDLQAGRRAFLRTSGLLAAGAALVGGGMTAVPQMAQAQAINDPAILNFALNLEYLEAEFYLRAAFGRGLRDRDTSGVGPRGRVICPKGAAISTFPANLSSAVRNYAREIADDEEKHVIFLRSALKSAKVARPTINLDTSFTAAARAAGLIKANQTFNAFANDTNFLLAAFIFEDVGVTAYKGAARLISNPDILEAAAGILAVEAYHAGEVRTLLVGRGLFAPAQAISDLRDAADGPGERDQGIGTPRQFNVVPTDENAIVFSRTPAQVLRIVYLGERASAVSFFPNRLNGALR